MQCACMCVIQVTDIRGYMARSAVPENSSVSDADWHVSTAEPGWRWKGNTSSDEVVGHMFAYPLIHDFLEDEEEQESSVKELVDTIMGEEEGKNEAKGTSVGMERDILNGVGRFVS